MTDTQLLALVAPVTSLMIVIAGYIVQNANLNARMGETNNRINDLRAEFIGRLTTEIGAVRVEIHSLRETLQAEMAKNHSELLSALAQHEHRISRP